MNRNITWLQEGIVMTFSCKKQKTQFTLVKMKKRFIGL